MAFTGMLKVVNPKIKISDDEMKVDYVYSHAVVKRTENELQVNETSNELSIRTKLRPARLGLMLVGWGGNNGSTLTAALIANRLKLHWNHKTGERVANWYGSITQASTVRLGMDEDRQDVYVPMADMLPMVHPNDIVVDGWDISDANLAESMARAQVLDHELQQHLRKHMEHLKPRPAIYNPDFIASNQESRATSVLTGTKLEQFSQVRKDIREFKANHKLDQVIVLWTANTERFCSELPGVHSSAEELENALANDNKEISPSTIYAMAAIAEKAPYLNGSPQNTFVKGLRDLAEQAGVFIGGDDFKSGQTKLKSVLVDFLVSAGIKPVSIVSYNHLGNNDGKNLSAPQQFRSKEISKSNVVDDMVASNTILYKPGEKPDHCVVIKYVPYVGDSKRAMDEYTSEIMLGGHNTIVVHNTCEDSLLAAPIMLDLVLLTELFGRISFKPKDTAQEYSSFHSVLSPLSYLLKAPLVPDGTPVVNALSRQRACIENILRACLGLAPDSHLQLEHKLPFLMASTTARNGHHHSPPPKKLKNSSVTH